MTIPNASRTPFPATSGPDSPPSGLTLAHVLDAIGQAGLAAHRARDLRSAVRSVTRVLGADPADLPAQPRLLAGRLEEIAPAAHGIGAARWNNTRSLLRAGLALLGPIGPGRHLNPLSPEWQALWDVIDTPDRTLKMGLSRFMRCCSAAGIAPGAVDAAALAQFAREIDNSLLKNPAHVLRCARLAWTKAGERVPTWSTFTWPKPPRRADHFSLPWESFPATLRQDVAAWLSHLRGDDLMATTHRPLRPESLKNREQRVRAFASALVHRGRDAASITSLAALVETDAVKDGLRFYLERNGNKPAPGVADIAAMLLAIARHWVKVTPVQLAALQAIAARLRPDKGGMVETNRTRLRAFDAPDNVQALLHLPQRLLADADARPRGVHAAALAQTALAIELLLVAPMRIKNLASIDLTQHLVRPGRARGVVLLSFVRAEVKNDQVLDYPLPPSSIALLDRYLADYRPLLAPPGSTALFPGRDGLAKGRMVMGPRISRTIFKYTGLKMHPHLFRHFAAKLQLEAEPGSYEVMRRVLGHTSIATTTRAYAGTESAAAVRHYDKVVERLRDRPGLAPATKRRLAA